MNKFFLIVLYILWAVSLAGIFGTIFTNFQYSDLNLLVGIIFIFTLVNTFFRIKEK